MDKAKIKAFVDRCFNDMAGAMSAGLVYVGIRTGLFAAMAQRGPMSVAQVVDASQLEPRYVEEWLNGMAAAHYLIYDPAALTFEFPDEHAYLLASEGTDHFAGGMFHMAPALLAVAPKVAEAFVAGGGIHFEEFGDDGIYALDLINRGNYQHRLVDYWLKALPEVTAALEAGAAGLDIGCGVGYATLALATAYPNSQFVGIDLDQASIDQASINAAEQGLTDRVRFIAEPLENLPAGETFDLITACDCVHDFADPQTLLSDLRKRLNPDGTMFVVEPKASDRLEDNCHPIGAMFYGFSVFHCMTQSLAAGGPGLGTCMGPGKLAALVQQAGFARCEQLDIKSNVNMFFAVRA
ncbi:MAG: class I SAM-dependent methyltransferase [Gammaproteobacteria bacterium]|nr:class I SAM-dependent methyltransferase [Gammaproteobacteria bacterium]